MASPTSPTTDIFTDPELVSTNGSGGTETFSDVPVMPSSFESSSDSDGSDDFVLVEQGTNTLMTASSSSTNNAPTSSIVDDRSSSGSDGDQSEDETTTSDDAPSGSEEDEDQSGHEDLTAGLAGLTINPIQSPIPVADGVTSILNTMISGAAYMLPAFPQAAGSLNTVIAAPPAVQVTYASPEEKKRARKLRQAERKRAAREQTAAAQPQVVDITVGPAFDQGRYDDAVTRVTAYIANPPSDAPAAVRLRFLQCLIIELGLLDYGNTELPQSCKAAKTLVKNVVHINVKDYLARRSIGTDPTELRKAMYPSKSALIRNLRGRRSAREGRASGFMPRGEVKARGLQVLLVTCS